jgi:hypothetical protein
MMVRCIALLGERGTERERWGMLMEMHAIIELKAVDNVFFMLY